MPSAALERHSASPCAALRRIDATVTRRPEGSLRVTYCLVGDLDRVRIPAPRVPRAAERLWQQTCCELFVADPDGPGYREYNFSPSGEWAAYRFTRYREGAPFETADPEIRVQRTADSLELTACVHQKAKLRIGLSAVVEQTDGTLSYWALRHPPGEPDFHHRDTFALELDEVRC